MWYVILKGETNRCYGSFLSRNDAYQFLADHGGITHGAVMSDRAMQQDYLHLTIHSPIDATEKPNG